MQKNRILLRLAKNEDEDKDKKENIENIDEKEKDENESGNDDESDFELEDIDFDFNSVLADENESNDRQKSDLEKMITNDDFSSTMDMDANNTSAINGTTSNQSKLIQNILSNLGAEGRGVLKRIEDYKFKIIQSINMLNGNEELKTKVEQKKKIIESVAAQIYGIVFDLENVDLTPNYNDDQLAGESFPMMETENSEGSEDEEALLDENENENEDESESDDEGDDEKMDEDLGDLAPSEDEGGGDKDLLMQGGFGDGADEELPELIADDEERTSKKGK